MTIASTNAVIPYQGLMPLQVPDKGFWLNRERQPAPSRNTVLVKKIGTDDIEDNYGADAKKTGHPMVGVYIDLYI